MYEPGTYGTYTVMQILIDIEDPNPPFAQLIEQIKQAVSNGYLGPGDPLPSSNRLRQKIHGRAYGNEKGCQRCLASGNDE